jgi:hypothetical protein
MTKYIVEGNLSFYDELYKSLDEPETKEENIELCLITNAPLKENHVVLPCKHKFNYDAIYNDIYCHKKKYNSMERCSIRQREIRCPYCRTIHGHLLPYVEGYDKVHGVNYFDEAQENINNPNKFIDYEHGQCSYLYVNNTESYNNGEPIPCKNHYVKFLQLDGKKYCGCHYKIKIREIHNANKLKEKMEKKNAAILEKQKLKEEKANAKLEEKLKKQAEKLKAKAAKLQNENVIISSQPQPIQIDETKCLQILKTGKNKGMQCGCKIVNQGLCGRHYKPQNSPEEQQET